MENRGFKRFSGTEVEAMAEYARTHGMYNYDPVPMPRPVCLAQ